jgi:hypothetical protein
MSEGFDDLIFGDGRTLLDPALANRVIAACNRFLTLQVVPPLVLTKSDGRWTISLGTEQPSLPGAGNGTSDFGNEFQTYTASCPAGSSGATITVNVVANTLFAPTQAGADATALALATAQAQAGLVCIPVISGSTGGFDDQVHRMAILTNGNMAVSGQFLHYNGFYRPFVAILQSNLVPSPVEYWTGTGPASGGIYPGFVSASCVCEWITNTAHGSNYASGICLVGDTMMFLGGMWNQGNGFECDGTARLLQDGTPDTNFNTTFNGASNGYNGTGAAGGFSLGPINVCAANQASPAKVVCANRGMAYYGTTTPISALQRLNQDGSLDTDFSLTYPNGSGGHVHGTFIPANRLRNDASNNLHVLIQFVIYGSGNGYASYQWPQIGGSDIHSADFFRLNSSDALGNFQEPTPSGGVRHFFSTHPNDFAIQAIPSSTTQYIFVGTDNSGNPLTYAGSTSVYVVRVAFDGSLDNTFNPALTITNSFTTVIISSVECDGNGNIFVGGKFDHVNGVAVSGVFKIDSTGAFVSGFAPNITSSGHPGLANVVTILPVGTGLAIGGKFDHVSGAVRGNISVINPVTGALIY